MDLIDFSKMRTSERMPIPGYKEAWIEFYDDVLGEFMLARDKDQNPEQFGFKTSCHVIADWNLQDPKTGKKLQITPENVQRLPYRVQQFIVEQTNKAVRGDVEKKSESSSKPTSTSPEQETSQPST
jgi:hypothetical protein